MTVEQALYEGQTTLRVAGVESPRLEAEMLMAAVLKMPRLELFRVRSQDLTPAQRGQWIDWVTRRGQRIPLQHLLGSVGFLDLDLFVTSDVLIPRPETEVLVQVALDCVGVGNRQPNSSVHAGSEERHWLDFGTGSGNIALSLALAVRNHRLPVTVHALDRSIAALGVAQENARRNGLEGLVAWHSGDGFSALPRALSTGLPEFSLELLVSNPPYIPTDTIAELSPEVRDHDPRLALDGGSDGLRFYRDFLTQAVPWLRPDGWLVCEFGDGQSEALCAMFSGSKHWMKPRVVKDLDGRDRVLMVQKRSVPDAADGNEAV